MQDFALSASMASALDHTTDTSFSLSTLRERLQNTRVLIAGDVMLDRYWFGDVERISPEAPVPIVHARRIEERLGGAANVANNVSALGAQASLVCVFGKDSVGDDLAALLKTSGIQAHAHQDPALKTILKLRVISRQQQLLRVDFEEPPALDALQRAQKRFIALLPEHDIVLLSDYAKGALLHSATLIAAARRAGKIILIDPKGTDWKQYAGATILTPNRAELRPIIGDWHSESDLQTRITALRKELSIEALFLTRSEEGASLYTDQGVVHVATEAKEVYDVSGAGDTIIATLAALLGAHVPLHEAITYANRAAGIVVGKLGTAHVQYDELFPSK